MSSNEPVFIVGAPRSGTTLLSAMISSHSRIACGPETQFFHKTNPRKLEKAVSDRNWPKKAVKLLCSIRLTGQYIHELFGVTPEKICSYLKDKDATLRSMLESVTEQHARNKGKVRWAEKTPNHLLHLERIRREFPKSPIIRIMRDPRDSAISISKLPWGSSSALANGYLWDTWYRQSLRFFKYDRNSLTVRYEDLVNDPEKERKTVCEFMGEGFEPEMLDTSKSGEDVASPNEPWKDQVNKPLDPSRLYAWKKTTEPEYSKALAYSCISAIEEFGYEMVDLPEKARGVYIPSFETVEQNENVFIKAAAEGVLLFKEENVFDAQEILILPGKKKKFFKRLEAGFARWWIRSVRKHRGKK